MELSSAERGESATPILQINDLSVARSGEIVIQEVNLDIRKGEFVGLVGPNGSGKSNVIDAMLFVFGKRAKQMRQNKVAGVTVSASPELCI